MKCDLIVPARAGTTGASRITRHIAVLVVALHFLSGCSLYPRVPSYSITEIQTQATLPAREDTFISLEAAKKVVNGWRNVFDNAQRARHDWKLAFGELIFYGSILAVLGVATHHDHVRNVGAGIAGTSSLLDSHYQLETQRVAFRKAEGRLACIERALMQITPQARDDYADGLSAELRATLTELPVLIVGHTETARNELRDSLTAIVLSTPSRQDIVSTYKALTEDIKKVEQLSTAHQAQVKAMGTLTRAQIESLERRLAFVATLTTVKSEMEVCMKA